MDRMTEQPDQLCELAAEQVVDFQTEIVGELETVESHELSPDADKPGYGTEGPLNEDGEGSSVTDALDALHNGIRIKSFSTEVITGIIHIEGGGGFDLEGVTQLKNEDGTIKNSVVASNGNIYSARTRRNDDGSVDLILSDSEGEEFVLSNGTEDELDYLNNEACKYAYSMRIGDELGEALIEFIDSGEVQEEDEWIDVPEYEFCEREVQIDEEGDGQPFDDDPIDIEEDDDNIEDTDPEIKKLLEEKFRRFKLLKRWNVHH